MIAIIATQFLKSSVEGTRHKEGGSFVDTILERVSQSAEAVVIYGLALAVLYKFTSKYTAPLLITCGAVAGQFLLV